METNFSIQNSDCEFTGKVIMHTDSIHIIYNLLNKCKSPIYLFNRLAKYGGKSVFDTDKNSVNIVLSPTEVLISKSMPLVPIDKEIERAYIPCVNRVETGQKFSEHITLPYPLSPITWYKSRKMTTNPVIRKLVFQLGYASNQGAAYIKLVDTPYGKLYAADWFPVEQQQIISADLLIDALVFSTR